MSAVLLNKSNINEEVITQLLSLRIGTREQCIDAYLATETKTNLSEMKQYLINNHSSNDTMTDSYTDDIKENLDHDDDLMDPSDDVDFQLLPVGLLPQYEEQFFMTADEDKIEKLSPIYGWCLCDATTFDVRRGPNYVSGQKAPSKRSIYEPFAMDTYSVPYKINDITHFMDTNKYIKQHAYSMNKEYPLPPILIINIMVPNYSPEITSYKTYNGKGYQVIIYAKLSDSVKKVLTSKNKDNIALSPALKLLSRFVTEGATNTDIRDRFKCMGRVMNLKYTGFNFVSKKLISEYNAKPFLARCSTIIHHQYGEYLSIDLDAHQFGYVAKKMWHYIKDIMENVIYDLAFVIEGHSNDELPEQMLTAVRISKVAAQRQKPLPVIYIDRYNKCRQKDTEETIEQDKNKE
eukprot:6567_1